MLSVSGLHHVTSICSDAQENINFLCGVLGLRLVKVTVNFDDPGAYHLYYGDEIGAPGTLLTTFAWPGATRSQSGVGSISATALAVPTGALGWWQQHLTAHQIEFSPIIERFGERVLPLRDPDGLVYELIESPQAASSQTFWRNGGVPENSAIRGLHSVTLALESIAPTAQMTTDLLGFTRAEDDANRTRFRLESGNGGAIDVVQTPAAPRAETGAGAIHHVAFRAPDTNVQSDYRKRLLSARLNVSPVMERTYFESIYFREPGGVLFEIATDAPGFTVDETVENLGTALKLPPQYESYRAQIEARLPPLEIPQ